MSDAQPRALPEQIAAEIDRRDLLRGVDHLLVACSGGGDSVALVELLVPIAARRGVRLSLAILDHGVRETRRERRIVEGLAQRHRLPLLAGAIEPRAAAGSEDRWRRERLAFLGGAARQTGADAVAMGHTLDDQVETMLINLGRGSGRRGLGGMRWRRSLDGLLIVRPLLGVTRQALREHLIERGQGWAEDPTNVDSKFARNRVRAWLVPALERALPGATERLARAGELLAEEESWLEELAAEALVASRVDDPLAGAVAIDAARLVAQPAALVARVLRLAIRQVRGDLNGIERRHIEELVAMLGGTFDRARDLPGVRARLEDGALRLLPLRQRRVVGLADA